MATDENKIEQLTNGLRERIKKGEFGTGGRLPSVATLSRDHSMSRAAVYDAIHLLQSDGLLIARDNSYYVNYPIMKVSGAPLFDKYIIGQGLTPVTDNIIAPEIVPMPADIAGMFGMQEGVHVIHRMRRHGIVDIPYRLAENWYPLDLAGDYLEAMKQNPDLNVAGEIRKNKGVAIAKRYDDITARLPTVKEAGLLNIVRTTPIMDVRRKFVASDDRVIFVSNQVLVGAFFQLSYESPHHRKEDNGKQG